MAKILSVPEIPHDCYVELEVQLGFSQRAGTRAECSCGKVVVFFRRRKKLAWLYEFLNDWAVFLPYLEEELRGWTVEL